MSLARGGPTESEWGKSPEMGKTAHKANAPAGATQPGLSKLKTQHPETIAPENASELRVLQDEVLFGVPSVSLCRSRC